MRKLILLPFVSALAALFVLAGSPAKAVNITPSMIGFKQLGQGKFEVVTSWKIVELPPKGYVVFTHFTSPTPTDNGDILTQPDPGIDTTDKWQAGSTLVSKVVVVDLGNKIADGTYFYKVGMYSPTGGDRLELRGNDDGEGRYVLAKIIIAGGGATITSPGTPAVTAAMEAASPAPAPAPAAAANTGVNVVPSIVNFKQTGDKAFAFQAAFDLKTKLQAGWIVFVHLTTTKPDDHDLIVPYGADGDTGSETWTSGQKHVTPVINASLPDTVKDGTYNLRVGLWRTSDGGRLQFAIPDDGSLRYTVGSIVVSGGGAKLEFQK
ncbi:MAG: hypothetical protein P4L33_01450 [Capsulimonadaceae bacterium]|nr:hypothetical protein [Capsulimonadaceae bacterium]